MSAVHNDDIRDLLTYIPVVPDALMKIYLQKEYNMTAFRADETIYNACRYRNKVKPTCYATNSGLARFADTQMTSNTEALCRAFRVACEFLPGSRDLVIPHAHPWLLTFNSEGNIYYVCEFKRNEELITADLIRSAGIAEEMMPFVKRVAILAPGANREFLNDCGIKYFCTIDDQWNLNVVEAVKDSEVWNGVPVHKK